MQVTAHLVKGYCLGHSWYGNYGACEFGDRRLTPEELEKLPIEDYSGFGFQDVEGLILFVRDIIKVDGREFVSLDGHIEERGEVKDEAYDIIFDC